MKINGETVVVGNQDDGSLKTTLIPNNNLFPAPLVHVNQTFGADLNIDASVGGTPDLMYAENLGTGGGEWDATAIVGGGNWDFASGTDPLSGSVCIDATGTANGDICDFADGGDVTGFIAITFWIKYTQWSDPNNNDLTIYGWESGALTGNAVSVPVYSDVGVIGVWQKVIVPITDMGLTGANIDSIRFEVHSDTPASKAPNFFLDEIILQESGIAVDFIATPEAGTWFYITSLRSTIVIPETSVLADSTIPVLDPNKWFGLPKLLNPVTTIMFSEGQVAFSIVVHDVKEYLQIPNANITNMTTSGANTIITIETTLPYPLIMKSEFGDASHVIVNDDLSSLGFVRFILAGYIEIQP